MSDYFVEDTGTEVRLDMGCDIKDGTVFKIKMKRSGGSTDIYTAARDGDQHIVYTTTIATWPTGSEGVWQFQGYVEIDADHKWHGDIVEQEIKAHL